MKFDWSREKLTCHAYQLLELWKSRDNCDQSKRWRGLINRICKTIDRFCNGCKQFSVFRSILFIHYHIAKVTAATKNWFSSVSNCFGKNAEAGNTYDRVVQNPPSQNIWFLIVTNRISLYTYIFVVLNMRISKSHFDFPKVGNCLKYYTTTQAVLIALPPGIPIFSFVRQTSLI